MNKKFITYGFKIDLNRIIKKLEQRDIGFNRFVNKPDFGLWGSPVDSSCGWKEWCENNEFHTDTLNVFDTWSLKQESNILIIDSFDDLVSVMEIYGKCDTRFPDTQYLDFSKIMKDFDGMYLTDNGNGECHFGNGMLNLNAWDCESIVVWNPNVIEVEGEC